LEFDGLVGLGGGKVAMVRGLGGSLRVMVLRPDVPELIDKERLMSIVITTAPSVLSLVEALRIAALERLLAATERRAGLLEAFADLRHRERV
jgi:hypothetical protein